MPEPITKRIRSAWNAFMNKDPTVEFKRSFSAASSSIRPDRLRLTGGNERSIITAIYERISIDCSSISIQHVRLDDNNRFKEVMKSDFNECLTVSANIDQTSRAFFQDIVMSLFDEGCIAIVPVDTTDNPFVKDSFDIQSMRTGKILEWYPYMVKVRAYNERTGNREDIMLPKSGVAIVENPFYSVMNQPNSTLKRLTRKLALLDIVDENHGAGKLDLIIQLPYVIKTDARREQAEIRRKDIETQLSTSKYGVAYTDGTEKITQLNRPLENQLLAQIESLTKLLYSQLGITEEIMNGTANEETMNNYLARTVEPIVSAIIDEMKRKFLTKTARTQKQSIIFFKDPFKLVPASQIAELADKLTRNEIMTSNEIRQLIGIKPSEDPNADVLRNKNLSASAEQLEEEFGPTKEDEDSDDEA